MGKGWFGRWRRVLRTAVVVLALMQVAQLSYRGARFVVLQPEETAAARGYHRALDLGCFACHGPAGGGGVANPGSQEGTVPAFTEQTQMMYAKTPQVLREYILDGAPSRKRDDPDYRAEMDKAALHMPGYRDVLTAAQVEDLVAYLRATSGLIAPDNPAAQRGAELALEYDCFECHGALGAGGVANPGSFKGYIPGFWGGDFAELVHGDEELRQWIADGKLERIAEHPIGRIFFERQKLKMPAYGRFLPPEDIAALAAYVGWVHAGPWREKIR